MPRPLPLRRIIVDTASGTFQHGFTHAGNLAYLSLVTLFPFVILIASIARQQLVPQEPVDATWRAHL